MNDMRKQFEAWATSKGYSTKMKAPANNDFPEGLEIYANIQTMAAWFGWKAGRESLVVELPEYEPNNHHRNILIDDVKTSLTAAGVQYK